MVVACVLMGRDHGLYGRMRQGSGFLHVRPPDGVMATLKLRNLRLQ